MADVHSPQIRSKNMRAIRAANTRPEIVVRRALHALGFRFRLHVRELPGKPDLVFPRYKAIVFINGCFWHKHACHLFRWPGDNAEKWRVKLAGNQERDRRDIASLLALDWRVLICWECALRGKERIGIDEAAQQIAAWLHSGNSFTEISSQLSMATEHR